ncbi:DMT family transporter [Kurthia huakuii]|uniref:DMT family transporter n=1 Tax=Kurthia huakuii TaxID=1421019 RepID=UPI000497A05B|nr:multidrug efflux SMR transporter [Kurthia huakuii]MBM7699812.1 paired small multidrug resistance pump [Kurthia huakuii]
MGWLFVLVAASCEIGGVVGLRLYSQSKKMWQLAMYMGGFGLSFFFLYQSFNYLQLSIAYVIWIGIGTVGAVVVNILFFGEAKNKMRLVSMAAIIVGLIGLKAMA